MDAATIDALLYRSESESLDFKRTQYRFVGASDAEKAELIKDILAFANSWRSETAHILIGVDEVRGGPAQVVGVNTTDHLSDASLQQLVNAKTNRPVPFRYMTVDYGGKSVGVIQIDRTVERPFFLNRDFGRLKAASVYVRRGSSTDEATPDEVARMGAADVVEARNVPRVRVELLDGVSRELHTADSTLPAVSVHLKDPPPSPRPRPPFDTIGASLLSNLTGISSIQRLGITGEPSPEAVREHQKAVARLHPLRLWGVNEGDVTAHDVRVELLVPALNGLRVIDESDYPSAPGAVFPIPNIHQDLHVTERGDGWLVHGSLGKLQPGQERSTDEFYLDAEVDSDVPVEGLVFADNLPCPHRVRFRVAVTVEHRTIATEEDDAAEAP